MLFFRSKLIFPFSVQFKSNFVRGNVVKITQNPVTESFELSFAFLSVMMLSSVSSSKMLAVFLETKIRVESGVQWLYCTIVEHLQLRIRNVCRNMFYKFKDVVSFYLKNSQFRIIFNKTGFALSLPSGEFWCPVLKTRHPDQREVWWDVNILSVFCYLSFVLHFWLFS